MGDDRAVSTTLGYVLNLAVATLLLTGLLVAGGGLVEDQRERATRAELRVLGQQLAADLAAADRLAAAADPGDTVRVDRDLPATVTGSTYAIEVVGGTDPALVLDAERFDVTVRVSLAVETELESSSVTGGTVRVVYGDFDADPAGELEVRDG